MVTYNCFKCDRNVKDEYVRKKVRCPHCGTKMIYKKRTATTTLKAI